MVGKIRANEQERMPIKADLGVKNVLSIAYVGAMLVETDSHTFIN